MTRTFHWITAAVLMLSCACKKSENPPRGEAKPVAGEAKQPASDEIHLGILADIVMRMAHVTGGECRSVGRADRRTGDGNRLAP